ncbi:MAG: hypothetical protein A2722_03615 [Candidatus Doudnabacteria bacterium RIFCSPHIGHO2_01_FULL_50_11]|uniref:Uncharacterized protein n=1 Tax=Candidatus Doudnabacteria bacterium RIFCSPHIGHO2_01_FULL_50_11 TaxID=1817828 RepID=A0A1F5PIQ7_9BACT|nr:MAG: hypothetical protein A2722_03615 [Candidatus Doudnabacteria bacterium RIFCSPHIGHO2_01_FULL_50_11]HLC44854.1 hypothetical protein [Patescibacteria group bacterium]
MVELVTIRTPRGNLAQLLSTGTDPNSGQLLPAFTRLLAKGVITRGGIEQFVQNLCEHLSDDHPELSMRFIAGPKTRFSAEGHAVSLPNTLTLDFSKTVAELDRRAKHFGKIADYLAQAGWQIIPVALSLRLEEVEEKASETGARWGSLPAQSLMSLPCSTLPM